MCMCCCCGLQDVDSNTITLLQPFLLGLAFVHYYRSCRFYYTIPSAIFFHIWHTFWVAVVTNTECSVIPAGLSTSVMVYVCVHPCNYRNPLFSTDMLPVETCGVETFVHEPAFLWWKSLKDTDLRSRSIVFLSAHDLLLLLLFKYATSLCAVSIRDTVVQ